MLTFFPNIKWDQNQLNLFLDGRRCEDGVLIKFRQPPQAATSRLHEICFENPSTLLEVGFPAE